MNKRSLSALFLACVWSEFYKVAKVVRFARTFNYSLVASTVLPIEVLKSENTFKRALT